MYKWFMILISLAFGLYFLGDPILNLLTKNCGEITFWYCNLPVYLSYGVSILSGIALIIGVIQQIKAR